MSSVGQNTPPENASREISVHICRWVLGSTAEGNMTVTAPTTATTGAINLSFSGLAPGTKYLGSVMYAGTEDLPSPTIVRVDP